jgi:hypothetical protein
MQGAKWRADDADQLHRLVDKQVMPRGTVPTHRVYMKFVLLNGGWQVDFFEANLATSLPPKLTFTDPEKIRELALHGQALGASEARALFEYALIKGRGGIYLDLTQEQYALLKTPVAVR